MPSSTASSLRRGAVLGLTLGLVLSGTLLLGQAMLALFHPIDCQGRTANECDLEHSIARSYATRQGLAGGGLALFGLSLALWWRGRRVE